MWKTPASSTLKTYWVKSGGGGGTTSFGSGSSGTRTASSFSMSGVSTMKMMSKTSTTSTRGVMLMSERGPFLVPTSIPISGPSLVLQLLRGELHALELGLRCAVEHRTHVLVLGGDVGLDHDPLALGAGAAHGVGELLGRGGH